MKQLLNGCKSRVRSSLLRVWGLGCAWDDAAFGFIKFQKKVQVLGLWGPRP